MNLKPKKTKYTKSHKGRISFVPSLPSKTAYGRFSLVAKEPARIKASHLIAAELALKRALKKDKNNASISMRVFPQIPVTKKPAEVRMGKGKGNVDYWMTRVRIGTVLFDINCSNSSLAKIAFRIASSKLPVQTAVLDHGTSK